MPCLTRTEWGVRPGGARVGRSADAPPWGGGPPPSGTDPAGACDGGGATGGGGGPDASGRRGGIPASRAKGRVVTFFCPLLFSTRPKNLSLAAPDTGGSYLLQLRRWWRRRSNGEAGETNHPGHPHPRLGVRRVLGRGLLRHKRCVVAGKATLLWNALEGTDGRHGLHGGGRGATRGVERCGTGRCGGRRGTTVRGARRFRVVFTVKGRVGVAAAVAADAPHFVSAASRTARRPRRRSSRRRPIKNKERVRFSAIPIV